MQDDGVIAQVSSNEDKAGSSLQRNVIANQGSEQEQQAETGQNRAEKQSSGASPSTIDEEINLDRNSAFLIDDSPECGTEFFHAFKKRRGGLSVHDIRYENKGM